MRFIAAILLAVALAIGAGCASTVRPNLPHDTQASFDGTNQNSGFIGFAENHSGIITAHARDRYNALIFLYGSQFKPALKSDDGVTAVVPAGLYLIDPQHLVYFATMNRWHKEGKTND